MKQHYIAGFFILGILLIIGSKNASARTCRSISDGAWNQGETWTCGAPGPQCGDTVYIDHYVEVTATQAYDEPDCTTPMFLVISSTGELNFDSGRKLSFACGSGITVEPGGIISSDGGGASENIKICNTTVWQGSWDESLDGPVVLGSGLPIELLTFEAYFIGGKVEITWSTASETNNDFFTIERSPDGSSFEKIAIVDGAGNSNILLTYFETDHNPLTGNSYYRLMQTDFNGAFSYSKIVAVKSIESHGEMMLYPNPAERNFSLVISGFEKEEFNLVIRDLTGKEEFSKTFIISGNNHIEKIDPSQILSAGTYFVTATSGRQTHTQKLIVR